MEDQESAQLSSRIGQSEENQSEDSPVELDNRASEGGMNSSRHLIDHKHFKGKFSVGESEKNAHPVVVEDV